MTTFFCDLESGNDALDGLSFANRWKTLTLGATTARIAPGDIIKIMSQPDPTSLGNATWKKTIRNGAMPATVAISAVSNTTPIEITTSAVHGLTTGDIVQIVGQTGNLYINGVWEVTVTSTTKFTLNTSLATGAGGNATGTVRLYNSRAIKLATACTKTVDMCEVTWTASANVTAAGNINNKQGSFSAGLTISAAFTTGLVAYRALPASTDFSGYQQITFWVQSSVALAAGDFQIKLCSDAAGATPVDTFDIPAIPGTTARFIPFTVNKGSNLGAAIQSVALYAVTDVGAALILLDSIVAVKSTASADSLSQTSLIGKDSAADTWYPIASIEGTCILLDGGPTWDCGDNTHMGYYGTEETVTTYKIDPIRLTLQTNGVDSGLVNQDSGSAGNLITYSGGWDRTNMTVQARQTWVDCGNGLGVGWNVGSTTRTFGRFLKLGCVRALRGFSISSANNCDDWTIEDCHANGNADGVSFSVGTKRWSWLGSCFFCNNQNNGILFNGGIGASAYNYGTALKKLNCNGGVLTASSGFGILCNNQSSTFDVIGECCGNCDAGFQFGSSCFNIEVNEIQKCNASHGTGAGSNNGSGVRFGACQDITIHKLTEVNDNTVALLVLISSTTSNVRIYEGNSSGNANTFFDGAGTFATGEVLIRRWTAADTTNNGLGTLNNTRFRVSRWGGTVDDHRTFTGGGEIRSEAIMRHTASGVSYRLAPTSTNRDVTWPLRMPVSHIGVNSGSLVTASIWARRSNAALSLALVVRKNQLTGIAADQSALMTASGDQTPTSITLSGSTATVTKTAHGYTTGDTVQITGAVQTEYNITTTIVVTDADHFTYAVSGTPATPATGTLVMGKWEKLTVTFTPTEAGTVEVEAQAYGGSTFFGYVDDLEALQA